MPSIRHQSDIPFIDLEYPKEVPGFHSFEFTSVNSIPRMRGLAEPEGIDVSTMITRIMTNQGYMKGKGLGRNLQGITTPLVPKTSPLRFGLGYQPTAEEQIEKSRELRMAKLDGPQKGLGRIPHIRETFPYPSCVIRPESDSQPGDRVEFEVDEIFDLSLLFEEVTLNDSNSSAMFSTSGSQGTPQEEEQERCEQERCDVMVIGNPQNDGLEKSIRPLKANESLKNWEAISRRCPANRGPHKYMSYNMVREYDLPMFSNCPEKTTSASGDIYCLIGFLTFETGQLKVLEEFKDGMPPKLPKKLPLKREVDDCIDLELGAKPPTMAPYRMAPPELEERLRASVVAILMRLKEPALVALRGSVAHKSKLQASGNRLSQGRIVELLEALEAMAKDNQSIPQRAMILSRKYRTLVSSWIEPLQEEAELGYEIDYIARYIAEGGLTGERKRWVPRRGKIPLDPDALGFIYSNPMETSFKKRCLEDWKMHHRKLLKTMRNEGPAALGDASEYDYLRVEERLKNILKGPDQNALKPKAASKMIVSELKEELEAQDLPTDGTRNVLYQRVQKARRINRSRGRPLWVPPVEEEEEEVDEELDELISRIKLEDGNTEFWKRRFLGEGLNGDHGKPTNVENSEHPDLLDDVDVVEDVTKEAEDDEVDDEEEEVEQTESQEGDRVKDKEVEAVKPLQMIGVQLLKDSDQTTATSRKSRRKVSRISMEDTDDDDWFPEDIQEAFKEMRERKIFDVSDMYTIADVWGWTWERELKNRHPRRWSQEWEVELAIKVMLKRYWIIFQVIELGGTPTIGDCATILRAAVRAPLPSAFLTILRTTHGLGYVFGSPLYDEIISLCLDLGEHDAAIAIVTDMETSGITVPDQTLDRVLSARQSIGNIVEDMS
ncbi:hypothetical protein HHK36_027001 [Tetracentron sinense]|uniref:SAP domain-containing protein n=1 Tax=Tetracentron sinense TaxID=13715 RepID=A0A834YKM0_TETSI|nr:hypothetical protein HHK36_027001 [Tetracentron sinense]